MAATVKKLNLRQMLVMTITVGVILTTVLLILFSFLFGGVGVGFQSLDVISIIEAAFAVFDYFTWGSCLFLLFTIAYFIILVQFARKVYSMCISLVKFIASLGKNNSAISFGAIAEIRSDFDSIVLLFLAYLLAALAVMSVSLTGLGMTTVIFVIIGFALSNLSITYSQDKLPNYVYLAAELVRFVAIPMFIAQILFYLPINASLVGMGESMAQFFELPFEFIPGKTIVRLIFTTFVQPTFLIIAAVQWILLTSSTLNYLFQTNEPRLISGTTPQKKFFSIVKVVAVWMVCRCVINTFLVEGNLNFDFGVFFEKWVDLVSPDLFPMFCFALGGGILLIPKFKKSPAKKKKKTYVNNEQNETEEI